MHALLARWALLARFCRIPPKYACMHTNARTTRLRACVARTQDNTHMHTHARRPQSLACACMYVMCTRMCACMRVSMHADVCDVHAHIRMCARMCDTPACDAVMSCMHALHIHARDVRDTHTHTHTHTNTNCTYARSSTRMCTYCGYMRVMCSITCMRV